MLYFSSVWYDFVFSRAVTHLCPTTPAIRAVFVGLESRTSYKVFRLGFGVSLQKISIWINTSFCVWQVLSLIRFTPAVRLSAETPALPSLLIKYLLGATVYTLIKSVCLLPTCNSYLFSKLSGFMMPFFHWLKQSSIPMFWKSLYAIHTWEDEGMWRLSSFICIYCCHYYFLFVKRTNARLWARNMNGT